MLSKFSNHFKIQTGVKMITIIKRDGTTSELSLISIMDTLNKYLNNDILEGINPSKQKTYIRKLYIQTINYLKGLKSIIIKELSTETSSQLQNTHFIELNLLRQTTYYKLNTTRP